MDILFIILDYAIPNQLSTFLFNNSRRNSSTFIVITVFVLILLHYSDLYYVSAVNDTYEARVDLPML